MAKKLVFDPVTGNRRYVDVPDAPKKKSKFAGAFNKFRKGLKKVAKKSVDLGGQEGASKNKPQPTVSAATQPTQSTSPNDLSQYTGNVMPTQTGTGEFKVEGDEFLTGLGQSLGLGQEGDILATLAGERPESVRGAYEDVIASLAEQTKGMTAAEKESISGTQRRLLAEQARKAGGRATALRGGQRLEQAKQAQMGLAMQEAAKVQEVEQASRGRAEAGRAGLAQLEMDIAKQDRDRQMEFDTQRQNIALQMYNLAEQRRIGDLMRKKLEE